MRDFVAAQPVLQRSISARTGKIEVTLQQKWQSVFTLRQLHPKIEQRQAAFGSGAVEFEYHALASLANQFEGLSDMEPTMNSLVCLRNVERDDLPRIYDFQLDSESNRIAVTIPRSSEAFDAHWEIALQDPNITAKAITVGDVLAGCISCFQMDGFDSVGYWLGKEFWGRGIATRALQMLLTEVSIRPLYARVATSNGASLRVLQKNGFVIERVQRSPADDRYPECEEALLVLT